MAAISGWLRLGAAAVVLSAASYGAAPARAADVIADWPTIQMPAAAHFEIGDSRSQDYRASSLRLHEHKLQRASALR